MWEDYSTIEDGLEYYGPDSVQAQEYQQSYDHEFNNGCLSTCADLYAWADGVGSTGTKLWAKKGLRDASIDRIATWGGACVGGTSYGGVGGSVAVCIWNLDGEIYFTVTEQLGAGFELGVGVSFVSTNASGIDELVGSAGCIGGGAFVVSVDYCFSGGVYTFGSSVGHGLEAGVHASGGWTQQIFESEIDADGVDADVLRSAVEE